MLIFLILVANAVDVDGPWNYLGFSGYAGEIEMNADGSTIFYWQFDALNGDINSDRLPLIINIGGRFPGCSSEVALVNDKIAPFYLDINGNPIKNNATWSLFYHIVSVDFPYDTGFSYAASPTDLKNSTDDAVEYLYTFLQILGGKYPKWFSRDVYVFGENKAGHFAPVLASMILQKNTNTSNVYIPLKGIAINDPWISTKDQAGIFHTFGYSLGLLNIVQKEEIQNLENLVLGNLTFKNYEEAFSSFNLLINTFESYSNSTDLMNYRQQNIESFGNLYLWMNLPGTKTLLHLPSGAIWNYCNEDVDMDFGPDSMQTNTAGVIGELLNSIKVLIFNTQDNIIANTFGVSNAIHTFSWSSISNFGRSRRSTWYSSGQIAGYAQAYSNLTYVQLINYGTNIGYYKPFVVRDMVNRFIMNQGWN